MGPGWIGRDDFGEIDRIGSEAIVTEFFHVILPVWPSHSVYLSRSHDGEAQRIDIPLQRRSVLLGYLRAPTWMAALILGLPGLIDPKRWAPFLVAGIALTVVASMLTFVAGRLAPGERARRALLRHVVGFGAPPELLPRSVLDTVGSQLVQVWNTESTVPWQDAIANGDALEILVAIAEYHRDPDLIARAYENLADHGN